MQPEMYFVLGFIALVAIFMVGAHLRAKKRTTDFEAAAGDLGLSFAAKPSGDALMSGIRGEVRLFDKGRRRTVRNLMSGQIEDLVLHAFDYAYTIGSGKNSSTYRQTVVALQVENSSLPKFELRPEKFFHKIGSAMGYQDIDLEEHTAFSRAYLLRGPDEEAIRATMTHEIVDHLLTAKNICVESATGWLVLYRGGRRVKPAELAGFIDEAFAISNRLL